MQPAVTHTGAAEKLAVPPSTPPPDTPSEDEELLDSIAMDKLYLSDDPGKGMSLNN